MIIFKDWFASEPPAGLERGSYVTIGSFDGVHQGHRQLLSRIVRESRRYNGSAVVITFDPLPKQFFGGAEAPPIRLTSADARAERIASLGVDMLLEYTFNPAFSQIGHHEFIDTILARLNPKKLYVGKDFRFGHKGKGDPAVLAERGRQLDFETEILDFVDYDQERISSTRVRNAVKNGELRLASELMGREHEVRGRLTPGMNGQPVLFSPGLDVVLPPPGSYSVRIRNGGRNGVAHARILDHHRAIEVDVDRKRMNGFWQDDVSLVFLEAKLFRYAVNAGRY